MTPASLAASISKWWTATPAQPDLSLLFPGGETFQASLSLALGLADVVQSYAGGVHLESLFLDEGFGSLDVEALDHALQILTELRQGGRSIGIISHVSELKERIATRIEVVPQTRGSIARIVGGISPIPVATGV
jgi:DNA repair exonuclease SbcCD ATPase subunit